MQVTVELNYLRIAPRKVRQAANLVRGKKAGEAEATLSFLVNRPAKSVLKLLKSAIAAAKNDFQLEPTNLYISKIFVNEGPKLKRWQPISRGSVHPLWKRTSRITLILDEVKPTAKTPVKSREAGISSKTKLFNEVNPVKSAKGGFAKRKFNRVEKTVKEISAEPAKIETAEETTTKETDLSKRKEKPRFERKERKLPKTRSAFNRIFRRKAF